MIANRLFRISPFLIKKLPTSVLVSRLASSHGHGSDHKPEPLVRKGDEIAHDDHHHGDHVHYTLKGIAVDPYVHHDHDDPGPMATMDHVPIPFKPYQQEIDSLNRTFNKLCISVTIVMVLTYWYYMYYLGADEFWHDTTYFSPSRYYKGKPGYETAYLKFEEWQKFMPEEFKQVDEETVYGEEAGSGEASEV